MTKYSPLLFLLYATVTIQKCATIQPKLNVEVLYESLCPDSFSFITKQLQPVWRELEPYVDLKFVPFGKSASIENGKEFVCQHGPQECKGNRIQSCALAAIPDQTAQVEYVNCFMTIFRKGHSNEGQSCAQAIGLDFGKVAECYGSEQGTAYQLLAEKETVRIRPRFIPTILYNGEFDQQLQDASLVNFRSTVCQLITQIHPEACRHPSPIWL